MPTVHLTAMFNTKVRHLDFLVIELFAHHVQFSDSLQFCDILRGKKPKNPDYMNCKKTWRPMDWVWLNPSDTLGKASFFTHTGDSHDGCGWAEEPWWTVQPLVQARLLFHNRPNIGRSLLGFGSSDQTGPASERDATAGQKVQLLRETWAPGPDTPCNFLSSSDKMLFLHFCFC